MNICIRVTVPDNVDWTSVRQQLESHMIEFADETETEFVLDKGSVKHDIEVDPD